MTNHMRRSITQAARTSPGSIAVACCALVAAATALVIFTNGLTVPTGTAYVTTDAIGDPDLDSGWLTDTRASASFHFGELEHVTDRLASRLGVVAVLMCIAVALVGVALLMRGRAESVDQLRVRGWRLIGLSQLCVGTVVPIAAWVQSAAVLTAAGEPAGLAPEWRFGWGWMVGGLITLLATRLMGVRASRASTEVLPSATTGPAVLRRPTG